MQDNNVVDINQPRRRAAAIGESQHDFANVLIDFGHSLRHNKNINFSDVETMVYGITKGILAETGKLILGHSGFFEVIPKDSTCVKAFELSDISLIRLSRRKKWG